MQTVRRVLQLAILAGTLAGGASAQPVVSAVLNGASYSAVMSSGCWVAIFGSNLAAGPLSADTVPLPTTLGDVSVDVGDMLASLLYVSAEQINAFIPFEVTIPNNTVVPLVVTSPEGESTYNIRLTRNAPAIFTSNGNGLGAALVFDADFKPVEIVGPGDTVILYANGLGPTTASGGLDLVDDEVEVYLGERKAEVLFAGLAPGFPGVYQLNVAAPALASDRVYLRSGGWQSNIAEIGIRSGTNTTNVSGSVESLFPSSDPAFPATEQRPCEGEADQGPCGPLAAGQSFSVVLHSGSFSVSFDIAPSAVPFDVAAVGEAGGTIVSIDPAAGTFTATVSTTRPGALAGDLSTLGGPLWDYVTCDFRTAVCLPFPDNAIPLSRLSLFWVNAIQMLPIPNMAAPGSANGSLQVAGAVSGSRFAVDGQNNPGLSRFGGFVQVPYGPFATQVSTFKLYVDGTLVDSKDLPYVVFHRAQGAFVPDF